MKIDSHQHFWQYDPARDTWIDDTMPAIRRDFMPADLKPVLEQNQIDGCVAVQADQSEVETLFLLQLAGQNDFVKGVVGWTDLQAADLDEKLDEYKKQTLLKGFRHVLQSEPDDAYMLRPAFVEGVQKLGRRGFTYDILIFPRHLPHASSFVQQCDDQPLVLDHLAKPYIKDGRIEDWARDIRQLAIYTHVHCKVSGMITEADWTTWTYEQLVPYLDVAFEAFGPDRLLFGSDWPVCLLAGEYQKVKQILVRYMADFSESEKDKVFGGNAVKFYGLK
jgi:L-fuconolactonase